MPTNQTNQSPCIGEILTQANTVGEQAENDHAGRRW